MLLGQAMKNWMVTEEECGVHRCFLFYVKKGAFRVCMLLEGEGNGIHPIRTDSNAFFFIAE